MSEFTDGLRAMADWLDERPEVKVSLVPFNIFMDKERAAAVATTDTFEKDAYDNWFWLCKRFGPVQLHINVNREDVCELVTVGEEEVEEQVPVAFETRKVKKPITEWRCGSLLAKED